MYNIKDYIQDSQLVCCLTAQNDHLKDSKIKLNLK